MSPHTDAAAGLDHALREGQVDAFVGAVRSRQASVAPLPPGEVEGVLRFCRDMLQTLREAWDTELGPEGFETLAGWNGRLDYLKRLFRGAAQAFEGVRDILRRSPCAGREEAVAELERSLDKVRALAEQLERCEPFGAPRPVRETVDLDDVAADTLGVSKEEWLRLVEERKRSRAS
jgi:hypothetical protein